MLKLLPHLQLELKRLMKLEKLLKKMHYFKAKSIPEGLISLSDDSGLCIKALKDEPGILSARFARNCGGWYEAMRKLYEKIKINNLQFNRSKIRKCYCFAVGRFFLSIFRGEVNGFISWPPRGENGFGYDPFLFHRVIKKLLVR